MTRTATTFDPGLVEDPLGFSCGWRTAERPTLGEFAQRASRLLHAVRSLHPDMETLQMLGRRAPSERASPWAGANAVADWVLRHAWELRPATHSAYDHRDASGRPTAASTGRLGFTLWLASSQQGERRLRLSIRDTGPDGGGVGLLVPAAHVDDYAASGWFESFWEAVAGQWPVQYGATATRAWAEAIPTLEAGWVTRDVGGCTFSSDASLVEAVPAGVPWKQLAGGGIVVEITRRPDRLLAGDVAAGLAFRDRLREAGMSRLWPLD